jgi:signal transduction histidine kinase
MTWITWPRAPRRDLAAWIGLAWELTGRVAATADRAVAALLTSEPRTRPGRRSIALDALLAFTATIAMLTVANKTASCPLITPSGQCVFMPSIMVNHRFQSILVASLTTVPLAWRRLYPLTVFWLLVAVCVLAPHTADNVVTLVAVVLAAYSAVVHSRFRLAAMVTIPLAGLLVATAFPSIVEPLRVAGRFAVLLGLIPVIYAGQAVHRWRRRVGESQERLDRLEAEHEAATALALATERARIASELHDVVTHNVSVMIVQAGAARHVLTDSPGAATDALLAVESSGRAAMAELRHLLGLLSPLADGDFPASAGATHADQLQPQPGLGQLRSLADRVRGAGLAVELSVPELPPQLPPGLDLTAYRVIQEALTNVLKHAGASRATVTVDCDDDRLAVCVTDAGPAGPAESAAARVHVSVPGTGRGLLGLRERVALYGGELTAGPVAGEGWRVRASLPLDAVPAPLGAGLTNLALAERQPSGAEPAGLQPAQAP